MPRRSNARGGGGNHAATFSDPPRAQLGGNEFIYDVQGHYVVPPSLAATPKPDCRANHGYLSREYMRCIGADAFIKDIFLDSDMMVLSFITAVSRENYRNDAAPHFKTRGPRTCREFVELLRLKGGAPA